MVTMAELEPAVALHGWCTECDDTPAAVRCMGCDEVFLASAPVSDLNGRSHRNRFHLWNGRQLQWDIPADDERSSPLEAFRASIVGKGQCHATLCSGHGWVGRKQRCA